MFKVLINLSRTAEVGWLLTLARNFGGLHLDSKHIHALIYDMMMLAYSGPLDKDQNVCLYKTNDLGIIFIIYMPCHQQYSLIEIQ